MKTVIIENEKWFKTAPFYDVRILGITHLNIPPEKFEGKQPEPFKRALVRQVFTTHHEYGAQFDLTEPSNPFGKARVRKRQPVSEQLKGTYVYVRNGLRAKENDIRHEMMTAMSEHSNFETLISAWKEKHGSMRYKSPKDNAKLEFDFENFVKWALRRGWIEKV